MILYIYVPNQLIVTEALPLQLAGRARTPRLLRQGMGQHGACPETPRLRVQGLPIGPIVAPFWDFLIGF